MKCPPLNVLVKIDCADASCNTLRIHCRVLLTHDVDFTPTFMEWVPPTRDGEGQSTCHAEGEGAVAVGLACGNTKCSQRRLLCVKPRYTTLRCCAELGWECGEAPPGCDATTCGHCSQEGPFGDLSHYASARAFNDCVPTIRR